MYASLTCRCRSEVTARNLSTFPLERMWYKSNVLSISWKYLEFIRKENFRKLNETFFGNMYGFQKLCFFSLLWVWNIIHIPIWRKVSNENLYSFLNNLKQKSNNWNVYVLKLDLKSALWIMGTWCIDYYIGTQSMRICTIYKIRTFDRISTQL